jgi:hypothetical protein
MFALVSRSISKELQVTFHVCNVRKFHKDFTDLTDTHSVRLGMKLSLEAQTKAQRHGDMDDCNICSNYFCAMARLLFVGNFYPFLIIFGHINLLFKSWGALPMSSYVQC